jgi:hypothetical protein
MKETSAPTLGAGGNVARLMRSCRGIFQKERLNMGKISLIIPPKILYCTKLRTSCPLCCKFRCKKQNKNISHSPAVLNLLNLW